LSHWLNIPKVGGKGKNQVWKGKRRYKAENVGWGTDFFGVLKKGAALEKGHNQWGFMT